jgi:GH24 family phage-related lysozyme (muramidase)/O-acetyl-ADP-ribose deacetylase (regulator of RNase III)
MERTNPFTVSGPVSLDSGVYAERDADDHLFQIILKGEIVYVQAPRHTGKTSLIAHTAQKLKRTKVRCANIDLSRLRGEASAEEWYRSFIELVGSELELQIDVKSWWTKNYNLSLSIRISTFFERIVLGRSKEQIVIFIDETDVLNQLDFSADFFSFIRNFYESPRHKLELQRLSLVLLGTGRLDEHERLKRPVYTLARQIMLADFNLDELSPFAEALELSGGAGMKVMDSVFEWTNGHPYLTQRLCSLMFNDGRSSWSKSAVNELVTTQLLPNVATDPNLVLVRDKLLGTSGRFEVLKQYQLCLREKSERTKANNATLADLVEAGVVKHESSGYEVRNRIYREVFNDEWVNAQLKSERSAANSFESQDLSSRPGGFTVDKRYRLERRLGTGPAGDVYLAQHLFLNQRVAIRIVSRALLVGDSGDVAKANANFRNATVAAAQVRSPNLVALTDFGVTDEEFFFLVMEYVPMQETLAEFLQHKKPYDFRQALDILRQVTGVIEAVHKVGIPYGYLDPSRISLLFHSGSSAENSFEVRIGDVTIARLVSERFAVTPATAGSAILGDPLFMPPEQLAPPKQGWDKAVDIYALGVIAYQLFGGGRVPFSGDLESLLAQKRALQVDSLKDLRAGVTEAAERLILRAMAPNPAERPATALGWFTDLENALDLPMAATGPSSDCIRLVQSFEGCEKKRGDGTFDAYPNPATGGDPWTIGWGTTGPDVKRGVNWTQQQCDDRFTQDLTKFAQGVANAIGDAPTTQHQFDAMVSFAYNLGIGNLTKSALLKLHKAGDYAGAANEFGNWNKAGGQVLAGLTTRRAAEAALYRKALENAPPEDVPQIPTQPAANPFTANVIVGTTLRELNDERLSVQLAVESARESVFEGLQLMDAAASALLTYGSPAHANIFVGILGDSFSARLFEREYNDAKRRSLPCFIYIKEQSGIRESEGDTVALLPAERFESLKNQLLSDQAVSFFRSTDGFTHAFTAALTNWLTKEFLPRALEQAKESSPEQIKELLDKIKNPDTLDQSLFNQLRARSNKGTEQPWFYFSCAEGDRTDKHLRQFFEDLNDGVRSLAGVSSPRVGSFGNAMTRDFERWTPLEVNQMQTSRVLVALYSQNYFKSAECGKVWQVFQSRAKANAPISDTPSGLGSAAPIILPVLWSENDLLPKPLPAAVRDIQYQDMSGSSGELYSHQGLRYLLVRHENQYREFVQTFAKRLFDVATRYSVPPLVEFPALAELANPFVDVPTTFVSRVGSAGSRVKSLQQKLKEHGFDPKWIDGIFGSRTKSALIAFQKNKGLTADGIAGPATMAALEDEPAAGDRTHTTHHQSHKATLKRQTRSVALTKIAFIQGDLLDQTADAIVNAVGINPADSGQIGTALVKRLGPEIVENLASQGPLSAGETVITEVADKLSARYVIHVCSESESGRHTEGSVTQAITGALTRAEELEIRTIAFPSLGTGAAHFDAEALAEGILETVVSHLRQGSGLETIVVVFRDQNSYRSYLSAFQQIGGKLTLRVLLPRLSRSTRQALQLAEALRLGSGRTRISSSVLLWALYQKRGGAARELLASVAREEEIDLAFQKRLNMDLQPPLEQATESALAYLKATPNCHASFVKAWELAGEAEVVRERQVLAGLLEVAEAHATQWLVEITGITTAELFRIVAVRGEDEGESIAAQIESLRPMSVHVPTQEWSVSLSGPQLEGQDLGEVRVGERVAFTLMFAPVPETPGGVEAANTLRIPISSLELTGYIKAPGFQLQLELPFTIKVTDGRPEITSFPFELKSLLSGFRTIEVEVYPGGRVSNLRPTIITRSVSVARPVVLPDIKELIDRRRIPHPQPDVMIYVAVEENLEGQQTRIYLTCASLQLDREPLDPLPLDEKDLAELSAMAVQGASANGASPADTLAALRAVGAMLFDRLITGKLTDYFDTISRLAAVANRPWSWLIISDESAVLPWELVCYYGLDATGTIWYDKFLAERFVVSHWVGQRGLRLLSASPKGRLDLIHYGQRANELPAWRAALGGDEFVEVESDASQMSLLQAGSQCYGLHLLRYTQKQQQANLIVGIKQSDDGGERVEAEAITYDQKLDLTLRRPTVGLSFVNTLPPAAPGLDWCNTQLESSWLLPFMHAGASALFGPRWPVSATVDQVFVREFYDAARAGDTLGVAFFKARRRVRATFPDRTDWLAYAYFGHPHAEPYWVQPAQGFTLFEAIDQGEDKPFLSGETYRFRASYRTEAPAWYGGRLQMQAGNLAGEDLSVMIMPLTGVTPEIYPLEQVAQSNELQKIITIKMPDGATTLPVMVRFQKDSRELRTIMLNLQVKEG